MATRGTNPAPDDGADAATAEALPVQAREAGATEEQDVAAGHDAPAAPPAEPPAGERALPWRVLWVSAAAFVLTWSLLLAGAITLDSLGRDHMSGVMEQRITSMLSLEPSHPVDVNIGGSPLALQLLTQRLERVEVAAQDVALGELVGGVKLTATGVPFDRTQPFERVQAEVSVEEDVVASIAARVTDATVTSVELAEPLVKLGTTLTFPAVEVFGVTLIPEFEFDVGIGMEPFVSEGQIAFTPISFVVNDNELSAEAFADGYRDAAQTLMRVGSICVAEQLPTALRLETVEVRGHELVIGLGADNAVFSSEALATRGECD